MPDSGSTRVGPYLFASDRLNPPAKSAGADMLTRRHLMAASAASLVAGARGARAQADWPNRPVKGMGVYPPAGGADTTARILFQKLSEMWGKSFVIDNRGGAGGTIG